MTERESATAIMELYDYSNDSVCTIVGREAIQSYVKTRLLEGPKPLVQELIEIDRNMDKLTEQGMSIDPEVQDLLNQAIDASRSPYRRTGIPRRSISSVL